MQSFRKISLANILLRGWRLKHGPNESSRWPSSIVSGGDISHPQSYSHSTKACTIFRKKRWAKTPLVAGDMPLLCYCASFLRTGGLFVVRVQGQQWLPKTNFTSAYRLRLNWHSESFICMWMVRYFGFHNIRVCCILHLQGKKNQVVMS